MYEHVEMKFKTLMITSNVKHCDIVIHGTYLMLIASLRHQGWSTFSLKSLTKMYD
jgi:hypothetical protein